MDENDRVACIHCDGIGYHPGRGVIARMLAGSGSVHKALLVPAPAGHTPCSHCFGTGGMHPDSVSGLISWAIYDDDEIPF